MKTAPFKGRTTKQRRAYFESLYADVLSMQKTSGKNVSISTDEHGSVINFVPLHGTGANAVTGPRGACCRGNACGIRSVTECENSGGVYMGDGTLCIPSPCGIGLIVPPGTGACCDGTTCHVRRFEACGGTYYAGVPCTPNPCAPVPTGACCNDCTGGCVQSVASACLTTSCIHFLGIGVPCSMCPYGACCLVDGGCTHSTPETCAHTYVGNGIGCPETDCCSIIGGFMCCHHDHIPDCGCQCCWGQYTQICGCCYYGFYHACCCYQDQFGTHCYP